MPLIALPPFVFRNFGTAEAAVWFVLITLQGLQLLLESTVGLTFVRAVGFAMGGATQLRDQRQPDPEGPSGQPNYPLLSSIWSAMGSLYVLVGVLTFLLIALIGVFSTVALISQLDSERDGWGALVVFVAGAGMRAYGGRHVSYLFGVGRIAVLRWWEMAFWAISFVSALAVLLGGGGLLAVAAAYQIPLLVNLAWNVILVRDDQHGRKGFILNRKSDWSIIRQIWPGMWRAGIGVALYLGVTQGAGLYYASVGEAQMVAGYLFAMSLMRPMMQFAQVPFFTKLPQLAGLQASGNRAQQLAVAQKGILLSHAILAVMIIAAYLSFQVLAWASGSESTRVPLLLWSVIGLAAFLERIGANHLQLYSLTNRIVWHWANGGTAVLFSLLSWMLLPRLGALAFPTALCIAILMFYMPYTMWHSYRAFGLRFPQFELRTSALPLLSTVVLVFVAI